VRLSNSKVRTFRRCEKKYEYKYVHKLRPKKKGLPLTRGDWLHQMLQHHYDGEGWKPIWKELARDFNNLFEEEREELGDLPGETARIMRSYLRHWKSEDKGWHVIDSEMNETWPLATGLDFNFIVDLIVEDNRGGLWIVDHKTVKSFMDADFMLLDTQLARYFYCVQQMGYKPMRGIIFNEIRTKPPAMPKLLKDGGLSKRANIDTDYQTYLGEIQRHGLNPEDYREILLRLARTKANDFFRRTSLPKDRPLTRQLMQELGYTAREIRAAERRGQFPRTPDKACKWDCEYKDICVVELHGGDASTLIQHNFETRNREELLEVGNSA
jgi:hypothetical protein